MKRTLFMLCMQCNNVFLSSSSVVEGKKLTCGHGCGGDLKEISKSEATNIFEEKMKNERAQF